VLLVNSLYAPFVVGGAEVVTEMLASTLAAQGHRVSVATSCSRDQDFDVERRDGVDVYRFFPKNRWWLYERFAPGDRRSAIDKLRWRVADAWNRNAGERFSRMDRVRPDVVHTHNIKGFSPVIWHIARQNGIPVIHTAHSYDLICADGSLLDRSGESCAPRSRCMVCKVHGAWYRRQAATIDVFCSPSDYLLRAHMEAGVVPKRSAHVRNGVTRRGLPPRSAQLSEDRLVRYVKGEPRSRRSIASSGRSARRAVRFHYRHRGRGDGEARLEALAGADGRVRFHGFVDGERKDRLPVEPDAQIFHDLVENAPMPIAEAFATGCRSSAAVSAPFLSSLTAPMACLRGWQTTSLAICMMELSDRPDELRPLKQGASRSGNSWPTPETMASDYVDIYRSLLQRNAGSDHARARRAGTRGERAITGAEL
jgi:glycosyltransferase involved in cell wall biosynthesis